MQLCENYKITVKLDVKLGAKTPGIGSFCCCYSCLLEIITERWPWNWKNDPKLPYVISFSNLIFLFTLLTVMVHWVVRARALGCLVIFSRRNEKRSGFILSIQNSKWQKTLIRKISHTFISQNCYPRVVLCELRDSNSTDLCLMKALQGQSTHSRSCEEGRCFPNKGILENILDG